jgi:transcriptional regulator with XRE-family HTH domain
MSGIIRNRQLRNSCRVCIKGVKEIKVILKKIRERKNVSQEQLATMSGLNVRTIQRIEAGNKASMESLKSIAAALEVKVETLEQEIIVIDKTTSNWQALPFWVKSLYWGSNIPFVGMSKRSLYVRAEIVTAIIGIVLCLTGTVIREAIDHGIFLLAFAYMISIYTRVGDKYKIW